jgi:hypothetical protein
MAAVLTRRAKNRLRTERHLALQFNNWEQPMSLFRSDDSRDRRKSNRYDLQYLAQIDPGDGSALLSCVISDISIAAAKLTVGTQGVPEEFTLWFPAASPRGTAHRRPRRGSIRAGKLSRPPLSMRRISARKNRIRVNLPAHRITFNLARGSHYQNTKKSDRLGKAAMAGAHAHRRCSRRGYASYLELPFALHRPNHLRDPDPACRGRRNCGRRSARASRRHVLARRRPPMDRRLSPPT